MSAERFPVTAELAAHLRESGVRPKVLRAVYHHPATAQRSPDRAEREKLIGCWFREWCAKRHISLRDLGSIFDVSPPVARKRWTGEVTLNVLDISFFPTKHRQELAFDYLVFCTTLPPVSNSNPHE